MAEELLHHDEVCDEWAVFTSACNAHQIYSFISRHPSKLSISVHYGRAATASPSPPLAAISSPGSRAQLSSLLPLAWLFIKPDPKGGSN